MTSPKDATLGAIPLAHAALCVDCDAVIDTRVLRDTNRLTCRDHHWVKITRWLPAMPTEERPDADHR